MAAFHFLFPDTTAGARRLLATRGIRAFGDGLVSLLLPVYLLQQGYDTIEIGALATAALLGSAALVWLSGLLAHRLGADERVWPSAEDRFASDLLLPNRIADPWLRSLTESAAQATIPVALGAHTLVGPGSRLLVRRRWSPGRQPASARRRQPCRQGPSRGGTRDG